MQALFPDNTYGVDSGGDPKVIPKLTFEQFKVSCVHLVDIIVRVWYKGVKYVNGACCFFLLFGVGKRLGGERWINGY